MDGWMNGLTDERLKRWKDIKMDGWLDVLVVYYVAIVAMEMGC